MATQPTIAVPTPGVCLPTENVRNANAERQARYRQSEKGKAAYAKRLADLCAARKLRKSEWQGRFNRDRTLSFDGRRGCTTVSGVPIRRGDMNLFINPNKNLKWIKRMKEENKRKKEK